MLYHQRTMPLSESKMIEATLCFAVRGEPAEQVLLGRKKRGFGKGKYNGIGGKIEPGERPFECNLREVREEVGLNLDPVSVREVGQITFRFPYHPAFDHFVHVFIATAWNGALIETPEMAPEWFNIGEIPYETMWQDDAHWLPRVLRGEQIRAAFSFDRDNETLTTWEIETANN